MGSRDGPRVRRAGSGTENDTCVPADNYLSSEDASICRSRPSDAPVAELADALGSGPAHTGEQAGDISSPKAVQTGNPPRDTVEFAGRVDDTPEHTGDASASAPWCAFGAPLPEDLVRVVDVWPDLPQHIRQAILTLVEVKAPNTEQPNV